MDEIKDKEATFSYDSDKYSKFESYRKELAKTGLILYGLDVPERNVIQKLKRDIKTDRYTENCMQDDYSIINNVLVPAIFDAIESKHMFKIFYNDYILPLITDIAKRIEYRAKDFTNIDLDVINTPFFTAFNVFYDKYSAKLMKSVYRKYKDNANFIYERSVFQEYSKHIDIKTGLSYKTRYYNLTNSIWKYLLVDIFASKYIKYISEGHDESCRIIRRDVQMYFTNLSKYQLNIFVSFKSLVEKLSKLTPECDYVSEINNANVVQSIRYITSKPDTIASYNNADISECCRKSLMILQEQKEGYEKDYWESIKELRSKCNEFIYDNKLISLQNCLQFKITEHYFENVYINNYKLFDALLDSEIL